MKDILGDNPELDTKRVQVLINCLGPKNNQLLSNLTAPDLPNTKTYSELTELLKQHLDPTKK